MCLYMCAIYVQRISVLSSMMVKHIRAKTKAELGLIEYRSNPSILKAIAQHVNM